MIKALCEGNAMNSSMLFSCSVLIDSLYTVKMERN